MHMMYAAKPLKKWCDFLPQIHILGLNQMVNAYKAVL